MNLLQIGIDVLTTTVSKATNKILAQVGNVVGEVSENDNVEWWQHYGFFSRPPKPEKGKKAAQAIVVDRGGRSAAIASQDQRGLELYGNADHGEAGIYSAGEDGKGQARVLCKKDGSVNIYTTHDNTDQGRAVYLRVAPDGFSFVAPWGTLKFDPTGLHALHSSGASINLGGIAGLPAPLDQISSYVKMSAGVIQQEAAMQANGVGDRGGLANAPSVIAAITALQVEVAAVAAALLACMNIPGAIVPATHGVAAEAGVTAVGVATIILEATKTQIPTSTTSA